jgi:hypothetical protein
MYLACVCVCDRIDMVSVRMSSVWKWPEHRVFSVLLCGVYVCVCACVRVYICVFCIHAYVQLGRLRERLLHAYCKFDQVLQMYVCTHLYTYTTYVCMSNLCLFSKGSGFNLGCEHLCGVVLLSVCLYVCVIFIYVYIHMHTYIHKYMHTAETTHISH